MPDENISVGRSGKLTFVATDDVASIARQPDFTNPQTGSDDGHGNSFDPERHSGRRNRDGSWGFKRGRRGTGDSNRSGTRKRTSKAIPQSSIDGLSQLLIVVHAGFAGMTRTPELQLEQDDANTLSIAAANLMAEFNVVPDPKVTAIVGMVMACGTVYGPKTYMIRERRKEEREEKRKSEENPNIHLVS